MSIHDSNNLHKIYVHASVKCNSWKKRFDFREWNENERIFVKQGAANRKENWKS